MTRKYDFDLSDVVGRVDGVREILDVAVDVLRDYGAVAGDSRIERLARWIVFNLAVHLRDIHSGSRYAIYASDKLAVTQCDDHMALSARVKTYGSAARPMRSEQARRLATALLVCAERADGIDDP
jgi:hypothetical protein